MIRERKELNRRSNKTKRKERKKEKLRYKEGVASTIGLISIYLPILLLNCYLLKYQLYCNWVKCVFSDVPCVPLIWIDWPVNVACMWIENWGTVWSFIRISTRTCLDVNLPSLLLHSLHLKDNAKLPIPPNEY